MIAIITGLLNFVFVLVEVIFSGLSDLIVSAFPSKRTQPYNAGFLNPDSLLSAKEKGYFFGDRGISITNSLMHALIFGGSGSGKSVCILINSLFAMMGKSSLVVHDPSGELFMRTSGAFIKAKYRILVLNYSDFLRSEFFNPLARIKTISDIKKLARQIVQISLGGSKTDQFWNTSAENLLAVLMRYVIYHTKPEHQCMYNVCCLLNEFAGNPKKVDRLFVEANDDDLLNEYKAFIAMDSKLLMNIVATARASISIYNDPSVASVTAKDTINFSEFRTTPTVLYINNSVNDMKYYSGLSSIFFEQFFASVMNQLPKPNDLPMFFLLDEASSLYLNALPIIISNLRKYESGILQVYQSQSQLLDLYGVQQARNIISNSWTKVYLPGQPLETARELEAILGKFEYTDESTDIKKIRSLLSMDEIRILKESIILCGNNPAIKMKLKPFFEINWMKSLSELPPIELKSPEDSKQSSIDPFTPFLDNE